MKDEKVLYETNVKYKKGKYDTKINITNNKITLLKKSGIFKRKYKIIEIINFNKINVYNDDVEVKRKHNIVEITTQEKIYKFECKTTNEAKRIVEDINAIEVAFNLHPNFWGKGYMKEACVEVMKYMFSLGFDNILCGYDEGNVKSAKINAKIGFKPYYEQKNAWYKNGIPITTYHNIMSKQDFDRLYLNDKNNQNDDVKTY